MVVQEEFFAPGEFADRPPEFEQFWKAYPRRRGKRVGKSAALRLWLKLKPKEQCEAYQAAVYYAQSRDAKRGFARDASRFLAADYWRDWLDGAGDPINERGQLVEELDKHRGKQYGQSTIVRGGLEAGRGLCKWEELQTAQLKKILEAMG